MQLDKFTNDELKELIKMAKQELHKRDKEYTRQKCVNSLCKQQECIDSRCRDMKTKPKFKFRRTCFSYESCIIEWPETGSRSCLNCSGWDDGLNYPSDDGRVC